MYRKLSVKERQERRESFRQNAIYRILYTPLWRQRGDDLSPEDVWLEANNLAYKLRKLDADNRKIKVAECFDDMCERYSCFQVDNVVERRRYTQAEHSAMMVSLVAFLLLANVYPEAKDHPFLIVCQSLTDLISSIDGYSEIWEEARAIEDELEKKGEFIEVADFIEQMAVRESPLSSHEITFAHKVVGQIVDQNKSIHNIDTMKDNERIISRVSDMNGHCFQDEVDMMRNIINEAEGNHCESLEYKNIIFAKEYEDKIVDIRNAILPFVEGGPYQIDKNRQNQWLAIIEPLKLIDGLLITHEDRPTKKECTEGEICEQMKEFFSDKVKSLDFDKIPKSLTEERKKWREKGVGLNITSWDNYLKSPRSETKYKALANTAKKVCGEVLKVIRR